MPSRIFRLQQQPESIKIQELVSYRTKADRNGFRRNLTQDLPINDANVVAISLHKELKRKEVKKEVS